MKRIFNAKKLRITALLLLCAAVIAGAVYPVTSFASENAKMTVKVGFFQMEGYHIQDENGARSGYGYEFLQLIAQYSNLSFEYLGYDKSWGEMQQMLQNGEIDLLTSARKTAEREELFDFSSSLIGTSTGILTVKAGNNSYNDGNYNDIRIGLIKNNSRNEEIDQFMADHGFTYTPVYYDDMDSLTEALQNGTDIDASMTSDLRLTKNEWILESIKPSPFYAIVKKGNTELMSEIDKAIERMNSGSPGWRTRLFNKYYSMNSGEVVAFTNDERTYLNGLNSSGRELRVTMNPDCAPYSYFEDGRPLGIVSDIFAETAARMGISYEMVEPADREEYKRLCTDGSIDIILDAMDDFHILESNGFEITNVYYSTPLAMLSTEKKMVDVKDLSQPSVSLLNEDNYSHIFEGITHIDKNYDSYNEVAKSVLSGKTDGAFMPYYCAQWLCSADVSGKLNSLMLPGYERSFVCAVSAEEDYQMIASLNKALNSLSEDFITSVVSADTEYSETGFSFKRFVYQNPALVSSLIFLFIVIILAAVYFADRSRRALKELRRSRRLERYIGYLCDIHYKVMEVDFDLHTSKQYMKRGDKIEIKERNDFNAFDSEIIYPGDADIYLSKFNTSSIRSMSESGTDEQYAESRMKAEDGEYHWYSFLLKRIPKDEEHPCSAMLLIKDVDDIHREREQSQEVLLNALDAANAASRSKSTFLSSMSHEIRTPLNAMIGYMTIASASIDNREKVIHCIDSAGVAARHLLSIINDVLDISAMESGKMKLVKDRFDFKEQLSGISTVFYQQCRQKNIKFTITINGLTEEWVIGDHMRVNQILMNLMSNAVKFTESEGSISLNVTQTTLTRSQVYIRFTVEDTGIGMSEEYLDRLFSPFDQENAQISRKYGGTGLGMSITLNLVNLMGGKIDVTSKLGEGSTFTITIPFDRTENRDTDAVERDFSNIRILVVDDLENECDYINALLTRCGIFSESAMSGEEAVRLVSLRKDTPEKFDLCIIDWNMPGFDGVETTRLIHEKCDPDIPIIIATAYDIAEFEEEAISAGALRIISKPLFQSTLFDLLVATYGKYDIPPENDDDIPDLSGMHVLLAEDNETNAEIAVDILDLAGVTADVARNGKEAVDLFLDGGNSYDAILMDVQMPVMDGYEATKAIRGSSHPEAHSIPIIAITADAFAENIASALAAGMDDHISKPIETELMFSVLKKAYRNNVKGRFTSNLSEDAND